MYSVKLEGGKVPGKRIKSTDPRKPGIVALFKQAVACCSEVTELSERNDGSFCARCLAYSPVKGRQTFTVLGVFSIWGYLGATIVPVAEPRGLCGGEKQPPKTDKPTCSVADALLAGLSHELLEKLVYHLAATSSECESCDDPAEVLRVIQLALEHPQITG